MHLPPLKTRTNSHFARRLILCILMLVLCVRGIVPTGYIPDAAAMRNGQLAITLCTADGRLSEYLLPIDSSHDESAPATSDEINCVFGMLALQAVTPPIDATHLPLPATADHSSSVDSQDFHISGSLTLGPPLGSRAPPSALS